MGVCYHGLCTPMTWLLRGTSQGCVSYAALWQCGVFHQLKVWNWRFLKRLCPLCIVHRGSLITGCLLLVQHNLELMCTVNPGSQIPLHMHTFLCSLNDNLMATLTAWIHQQWWLLWLSHFRPHVWVSHHETKTWMVQMKLVGQNGAATFTSWWAEKPCIQFPLNKIEGQ